MITFELLIVCFLTLRTVHLGVFLSHCLFINCYTGLGYLSDDPRTALLLSVDMFSWIKLG